MAPLYNQRRLQATRAAQEAAGTSFWTTDFGRVARQRIANLLGEWDYQEGIKAAARSAILKDEGWAFLHSVAYGETYDLINTCTTVRMK
jgi:hypothetical protein